MSHIDELKRTMYNIAMIPEKLMKETKGNYDAKRVSRVIRLQGFFNIMLLLCLIGSWIWFYKIDPKINAHIPVDEMMELVDVQLALQAHNGVRYVQPVDTLDTPFVTLYGQLDNYDTLVENLPDFYVKVNDTYVHPRPVTGEFMQTILLTPGKNKIRATVQWDGIVRYQYDYNITYIKPVTKEQSASTEEVRDQTF